MARYGAEHQQHHSLLMVCYCCQHTTGARVQTTVNNLDKAVLGTCERFEERQVCYVVRYTVQMTSGALLYTVGPFGLLSFSQPWLVDDCSHSLILRGAEDSLCVVSDIQYGVSHGVPKTVLHLLLVLLLQVGAERYNLFTGCPQAKTSTIVLRGGSEQFIDEAERSLHDAIMIVRRALKHAHVVAGGGAIDMEVSRGG